MSRTLKKVLTVANVQNQTIQRIDFDGQWQQAFGNPQNRGVWFVWGGSGSGKSTFMMLLAKEMAKRYGTLYDLLEEETDDAEYIERVEMCGMGDVKNNFHTAAYDYNELLEYIKKRGSKKVILIDSLRYLTRDFDEYLKLKKLAVERDKILICSGFAKGKDPRSEFEYQVMHDSKMKIFVSGYLATCKGRTIGPNGGMYVIWKEGYEKIQGANATNLTLTRHESL